MRTLLHLLLLFTLLAQSFLASADIHEVFLCDHTPGLQTLCDQIEDADCEHCQHVHGHQCPMIMPSDDTNVALFKAKIFIVSNTPLPRFNSLSPFRPPILA